MKIFSIAVSISLILCVLCTTFLYMTSCSKSMPSAESALNAMMSAEKAFPSGKVYLSSAEPGSENYAPPALLASLYGGGSAPIEQSEWVEFAIFLPTAQHPCELAVFLCQSDQSASDTAKMLCRRLDALKTAWSKTQYSSYVENACVTVSGNYCVFIVSSDKKAALKAAMSVIK